MLNLTFNKTKWSLKVSDEDRALSSESRMDHTRNTTVRRRQQQPIRVQQTAEAVKAAGVRECWSDPSDSGAPQTKGKDVDHCSN